jgi:hypothetical protein
MTDDESAQNRGSGSSPIDPFRLGAMHPAAGELFEIQIVEKVFGEKDKDWFYHSRLAHSNSIWELQIRLNSGQIRSLFFDESGFAYSVPLPEEIREILQNAATRRPVPDTTLVSRFPLIEVRAITASDAGRLVVTHVNEAIQQGWSIGNMYFFVDGWRFDQDLFKGREKTVMSFDMRPVKAHLSGTDLINFCSCRSLEVIDQIERRMKSSEGDDKPPVAPQVTFNWKPMVLAASRFGGIGAIVMGTLTLLLSHSFVNAVELALVGFVAVFAALFYHGMRLRRATTAEKCKEYLKLYCSRAIQFYRRATKHDLLEEYVKHIEGTPPDKSRWNVFADNDAATSVDLSRLHRDFEEWRKHAGY